MSKTVYVPVDPEAYGCGLFLGFLIRFWRQILVFIVFVLMAGCAASVVSSIGLSFTNTYGRCLSENGCIRELKDQTDISQIIFSPDGKWMAVNSFFKPVMIWEVQSDYTRKITLDRIGEVAFTPDSRFVVGVWGSTVKIWNVASSQVVKTFDTGTKISHLAVSPNGQLLAVGGPGKALSIWNMNDGSLHRKLEGQFDNPYLQDVGDLAFSPDGVTLAVIVEKVGAVQLWNASTGTFMGKLETAQGLPQKATMYINQVAFNAGGTTIALGGTLMAPGGYSGGGLIQIWDLKQRQIIKQISDPKKFADVWNISLTPDNKRLIWTDAKRTAFLWDIENNQSIKEITVKSESTLWTAVIVPNGQTIVTGDDEIRFWKTSDAPSTNTNADKTSSNTQTTTQRGQVIPTVDPILMPPPIPPTLALPLPFWIDALQPSVSARAGQELTIAFRIRVSAQAQSVKLRPGIAISRKDTAPNSYFSLYLEGVEPKEAAIASGGSGSFVGKTTLEEAGTYEAIPGYWVLINNVNVLANLTDENRNTIKIPIIVSK